MQLSYFQKINNAYQSESKQETELYLINRNEELWLYDNIDAKKVTRNGEPFEMLIIKDTDNNTYKKKIKTKYNYPFNLGDYIEWNNQIWIVTLLDPDDKTHHSGYMCLCTIILRWQDSNKNIIEKPCYVEDFTKYSSGVTGNSTIQVGENQYGVTVPIDEDTKKLKRDMRFPIDIEGIDEPDVYSLTNRKTVLTNDLYFNRGGIMTLTLSFDEFNKDVDKLVDVNGKKVWICNYSPTTSSETVLPEESETIATISGNKSLKLGYPRKYNVLFRDKDGNTIDVSSFEWNIVGDVNVNQNINNTTIELCVNDENYLGSSFLLQIVKDGLVLTEIEITITDGF